MPRTNSRISQSIVPHRALRVAKAALAHRSEMKPIGHGFGELRVGPFTIVHAPPEAYPAGPWHNVNIWRQGERKLANIEWNEAEGMAVVKVVSFRGGDWERELIDLLGDAEFEFRPGAFGSIH